MIPKEVKQQLKDFGYLFLGYITVVILMLLSMWLGSLWSPLEWLFYGIFSCLVFYPLGKNIANWFKSVLKD